MASLAFALEGCAGILGEYPQGRQGGEAPGPAPLGAGEFQEKVGTVENARSNAARGIESTDQFIARFIAHSPRLASARYEKGIIGSVFYNPRAAALESAVNLQLTRGKFEPFVLHDNLGRLAALQYERYGSRAFVTVFPSSVSLVGSAIHTKRSVVQLVINGPLPSDKIVKTNQDLDNLIGRQVTFADIIVFGLPVGGGIPNVIDEAIWLDPRESEPVPDGTLRLLLFSALVRLRITGQATREFTPDKSNEPPNGWQAVSETYRNFATGQLADSLQVVSQIVTRNAFEGNIATGLLGAYRPILEEARKRLSWSEANVKLYEEQKKETRVDVAGRTLFLHS